MATGNITTSGNVESGSNVLAEGTIGNTVTGINGISNYNLWNVNSTLLTELKNFISTYGQRYNTDGSENWGSSVKFTVNTSLTENGGIALWNETFKLNADAEYGISLRTGIGNPVERLKVHNNGNVGIGFTDPTEKLDVNGNIVLNAHANGNGNGIFFRRGFNPGSSTDYASIYNCSILTHAHDGGNNSDGLSINGAGGVSICTNSNVTRTERFRVAKNGNVGIGTIDPKEKLHVSGNINADGNIIARDTIRVSNAKIMCDSTFNDAAMFGYNMDSKVLNSQNYAIAQLENLNNSRLVTRINSEMGGRIEFWSGGRVFTIDDDAPITLDDGEEHARFDESGNFGIGTKDPICRLDVSGTINAKNFSTNVIGKITPVYARAVGNNLGNNRNNSNRLVKIGDKIVVNDKGRGLTLTIINANTHTHVSSDNYDTYDIDHSYSDLLANALLSLSYDQFGILTSFDAFEHPEVQTSKMHVIS